MTTKLRLLVNIRRLTDYGPMVFDANDMRFVIIYGETEDALADELKKTGLIDVTIDTRRGPYE